MAMTSLPQHFAERAFDLSREHNALVLEHANLCGMSMPKAASAVADDIEAVRKVMVVLAEGCEMHNTILAQGLR